METLTTHPGDLFFPSDSPINTQRLGAQNKKVFDHLSQGKTINCIQAQEMGITALNSRISELRNKYGYKIFDKFVLIGNHKVKIKVYSLSEI